MFLVNEHNLIGIINLFDLKPPKLAAFWYWSGLKKGNSPQRNRLVQINFVAVCPSDHLLLKTILHSKNSRLKVKLHQFQNIHLFVA